MSEAEQIQELQIQKYRKHNSTRCLDLVLALEKQNGVKGCYQLEISSRIRGKPLFSFS